MYAYHQQLSVIISEKYKEYFAEQACYDNVYHMVMEWMEELTPREKLRVLFCYRQGQDGRFYRHAFCLFDGQLIEPLLYLDMSEENRSSIVPIREMSIQEYLEMLCLEENTALRDTLYQYELDAVKQYGIFERLNPLDLSNLYREVDTSWDPAAT